MDVITSDGGLAVFTALGIVATALSIVRDAKAQKARVVTEDFRTDLPHAA
jgi:F0F1-type ATP synthase assembly protein I